MFNHNFEYFIMAIYYQVWLIDKQVSLSIDKILNIFLHPLFSLIYHFSEKKRLRHEVQLKYLHNITYNSKTNLTQLNACDWLRCSYYSYIFLFTFPLGGFANKISGLENFYPLLIVNVTLILLFTIPFNKIINKHNLHSVYFKQFDKESAQWHSKWRMITLGYLIGSIVALFIGLGLTWLIFMDL